jgi:Tol biopolymer transport system component
MKLNELLVGGLVAALLAGSSVGAQTASAAKSSSGKYWIVLGSDRDGTNRAYSIRPDGSRLTPLLARKRSHNPAAVSANGRIVAYMDGYVSRADGTGLRAVAKGWSIALSRDGRMVAGTGPDGIWVMQTNGRGRRRIARGRMLFEPDFSPDAKSIAYSGFVGDDEYLFVQPLRGKRRRLGLGKRPKWSPDGRWIAYTGRNGAYLVRPNGRQRRRFAQAAGEYTWSRDGRALAFTAGYLGIARVGGGIRKIDTDGMEPSWPVWAPDGRRLFLTLDGQLWTIQRDGRRLRRLTSAGGNIPLGWTRMAPVLRPAAPLPRAERALDRRTLWTSTPVSDLSADGERAAFVTESPIDCDHPAVWTPAARTIARFGFPRLCVPTSTGSGIYDLELAGSRVAWARYGGGNTWEFELESATLSARTPITLSSNSGDAGEYWPYYVRGDGAVLAFDDHVRLVQVGGGREPCQQGGWRGSSICKTIRRTDHRTPIESVSGSLIALREPTEVVIVDLQGNVVHVFPFAVTAARLDGEQLVVVRGRTIERYSVSTGAQDASRPLPSGYALADVDGGIAALRKPAAIMLVRLDDGRSLTIERRGPMFADLEAPGLYYSYALGKTGRVAFLPRDELVRRLR